SDYVPVDYRTTGIVIAGLVGFAILLQPVGWLITSSALFWIVSRALGSRRPVFDIAVSVIFASVIQIAFSAGLGLGLPAGILEGVVPWSN
ncbi:tripartite tricarboxylate transporter TctB family protein, partial [Dietzia sp. DQ11-38-2]